MAATAKASTAAAAAPAEEETIGVDPQVTTTKTKEPFAPHAGAF